MDNSEKSLNWYETGYIPSSEDERDYSLTSPVVSKILQDAAATSSLTSNDLAFLGSEEKLPSLVDLRQFFPEVQNQYFPRQVQSCTAHAIASQVAYYTNRNTGKPKFISRLFIYKVARNILGWKGDRGAQIRSAMAALAIFGAPPEENWPYNPAQVDEEPTAFAYFYARNNKADVYFRLDTKGTDTTTYLNLCKRCLSHGLTPTIAHSIFDYASFQKGFNGEIALPVIIPNNSFGGHAVLLVGYDDSIIIKKQYKNKNSESQEFSQGAFIIRNSLGKEWGKEGYGYLPYDYILAGKARDSWVILKQSWLDDSFFQN